jgi:hypothetical protein
MSGGRKLRGVGGSGAPHAQAAEDADDGSVGFKIIGWGRFSTLTSPGPSRMVAFIGYVSLQEMVGCSRRVVSATLSEIIGRTRLLYRPYLAR